MAENLGEEEECGVSARCFHLFFLRMRVRRKTFIPDAIQHIYQGAEDCGVIFYLDEDRLVYLTTAAVKKRKYGVKVCAAAIMFTHIHQSAIARSLKLLRKYLQDTNSTMSRAYNIRHSRIGRLFGKPPGIAQKRSWKEKKGNIIYVFNNHVEKKICTSAVSERWSLLAYAFSDHPFSEPIMSPSRLLARALRLVDRRVKKGLPLKYSDLHNVLPKLDNVEREQYIDYVICHYRFLDYDVAVSYFKDYESMVLAVDSMEGGEFNIKEDYYNASDKPFKELVEWFRRNSEAVSPYALTDSEKLNLIVRAKMETSARDCHLRRFFHMDYTIS